ncbi:hypothetical protein F4778DRAFT_203333 [Xylariomycetidae sp. FL2044]|nr:hypothetical protein F4778DRAFT_203333 [Xylariomycetidae sp. FL2044]
MKTERTTRMTRMDTTEMENTTVINFHQLQQQVRPFAAAHAFHKIIFRHPLQPVTGPSTFSSGEDSFSVHRLPRSHTPPARGNSNDADTGKRSSFHLLLCRRLPPKPLKSSLSSVSQFNYVFIYIYSTINIIQGPGIQSEPPFFSLSSGY